MNAHHLRQLVHFAQSGNLQASLQCTDVRPAGAHIEVFLVVTRQRTRLFERKCKVVLGSRPVGHALIGFQ